MHPLTLICFHHAGGSGQQYSGWLPYLPPWLRLVPFNLPGHGLRRGEPPLNDWDSVLRDVRSNLREPEPWALFGHSMGGLLALRLARELARHGKPPLWLGLAACRPEPRKAEPDWLRCPKETIVARLGELGGTPRDVLRNHDLLDLLLPVIRADFALCAEARPKGPPLPMPILALGGAEDSLGAAELDAWGAETNASFTRVLLPSDHFFPIRAPEMTVAAIVAALHPFVQRPKSNQAMANMPKTLASVPAGS